MNQPVEHEVEWTDLDKKISGLATGKEHRILVKREAIPIVFVPGIMGTRLRRRGTAPAFPYPAYRNPFGEDEPLGDDGLPELRWDPDSTSFMLRHYVGEGPLRRRAMMIGPSGSRFTSNYLEPDNANPVGNGRQSLLEMSYGKILDALEARNWGSLEKVFAFPVYAFGYNWTDTSDKSGKLLANRIKEIIDAEKDRIGRCEKVILVTHSMGGIVTRSASVLHGAAGDILGIIHGVQPVNGSPVAYWRIKAGFEISSEWTAGPGQRAMSSALGNDGRRTTVLLGNMPGGLELLPTMNYGMPWLRINHDGTLVADQPTANPYNEIYRERRQYWRLVDESLLDPTRQAAPAPPDPNDPNAISGRLIAAPWDEYLRYLTSAESFHDRLKTNAHEDTFMLHGTGLRTAARIRFEIESNWFRSEPYQTRGFRGFFTDRDGNDMQSVLQDPEGDGDGTVPTASATALDGDAKRPPAPLDIPEGGHEPIYQENGARDFVFRAIETLCKEKINNR